MRLYEIVDALADDSKYINSETGEIDVELLDKLTVDYNDKIDSICTIIQELDPDFHSHSLQFSFFFKYRPV